MLNSGTRLGPFEIVATLGSGGMGVVYRARDTRLDRAVAIKVLASDVAANEDRLRRFEREARAASALEHPNILTVHDVGTENGMPYIVSELLEGETLRQHLQSGAIPTRKALDFAIQITRGLGAAHDKGIVHRDLKPENVFLTRDGRVKILDFGLAKLLPSRGGVGSEFATETAVTQHGVVLGTVAYMSPEQVRGAETDHRTDLFSFGILLYEMVAGRRPFTGDTAADIMMSILTKDPPTFPETTSHLTPTLYRVIEHCLEKDPEQRFQSARDVAFDLENVSGPSDVTATALSAPRGWRRELRWAVVTAFLCLYTAGVFVLARRTYTPSVATPTFHQLTFRRGYIFSARFTPDGHTLLYGAAWDGEPTQLFASRADRAESPPVAIRGADILAVSGSGELALSLGRHYGLGGWMTSGTLARALPGSGAPREVLENVQDADWSRDGTLAITRRVDGRHRLEWPIGRVLYTTSAWVSHPRVSPGGDLVAYFDHPAYGDDRGAVAVADRSGKTRILSDGWSSLSGLAWSRLGDEVWFTASAAGTSRELHAVTTSGTVRSVLRVPASLIIHDISTDGRVLLAKESLRSMVAWVAPGERADRDLSWTDFSVGSDLSVDGRTVVLSEQGSGASSLYDVYLRPTDGSPPVRLGDGLAMALSPDQKWVLTLRLTATPELVLLPTRAGEPRHLRRGPIDEYSYVASWYPDGKRVLFQGRESRRENRLYAQSIDGGDPVPVTPEGAQLNVFADPISPDGRTVAAVGPDGHVWLYPEGGTPARVPALGGGEWPLIWSPSGQSLYTLFWRAAAEVEVHRLDFKMQRKTLVKEVVPQVPGIMSILHLQASQDPNVYVYTYWQRLSDLYLVEGLK